MLINLHLFLLPFLWFLMHHYNNHLINCHKGIFFIHLHLSPLCLVSSPFSYTDSEKLIVSLDQQIFIC